MRKTLLTLLASAAIVGSAHAAEATWADLDHGWKVTGNTLGFCFAGILYQDGVPFFLGYDGTGWTWAIGGADAQSGDIKKVIAHFDNGQGFEGLASGIGDGVLVIKALSDDFMRSFVTAGEVYVEGFGSYSLAGSAAAIVETVKCQEAMAESRLSRVWEPKPTDQEV